MHNGSEAAVNLICPSHCDLNIFALGHTNRLCKGHVHVDLVPPTVSVESLGEGHPFQEFDFIFHFITVSSFRTRQAGRTPRDGEGCPLLSYLGQPTTLGAMVVVLVDPAGAIPIVPEDYLVTVVPAGAPLVSEGSELGPLPLDSDTEGEGRHHPLLTLGVVGGGHCSQPPLGALGVIEGLWRVLGEVVQKGEDGVEFLVVSGHVSGPLDQGPRQVAKEVVHVAVLEVDLPDDVLDLVPLVALGNKDVLDDDLIIDEVPGVVGLDLPLLIREILLLEKGLQVVIGHVFHVPAPVPQGQYLYVSTCISNLPRNGEYMLTNSSVVDNIGGY